MGILGGSRMMTFYIIGYVITLLFLLSFFAWAFVNEKYDDTLDILVSMVSIFLLSFLSWALVFVIIMMLAFDWAKKNRKETK